MANKQDNLVTLYLVRHGETVWNTKDILQGHLDSGLTSKGKLQAQQVAEEFRGVDFDAIFASDLPRAHDTARIIAEDHGINDVKSSPLLRERNWGPYDGRHANIFRRESADRIKEFDQLSREKQWAFKYHHEIESHEEIWERFVCFLCEIAEEYPGKTLLAVSHLDVLKTLLLHLGEHPAHIDNLACVKIKTDGDEIVLQDTKGILMREQVH